MSDLAELTVTREFFVDARGIVLRTTWHQHEGLVVLSVWHGERCAGSVRLPVAEAARLAGFIVACAADAIGEP